jgi:hypothetical protein
MGGACAARAPASTAGETPAQHAPAATPRTSPPAVTDGVDSVEALRLFDHLVAQVRRYHVFAPATQTNLGRSWDEDLPSLRAEFERAHTKDALLVALWHFGNSLHDVHCHFRAKKRGERMRLGFEVGVEKVGDAYRFYVERVTDEALAKELVAGDIVDDVDGVPAARLIEELGLASNMNSTENVALDVATYLTMRRTSTTLVREGTAASWRLRPRGGGASRTLRATWHVAGASEDGSDYSIDYGTKGCVSADAKDYGPYELTARGYRLCIYTSTSPRFRDYPIVRQVSFAYDEIPHGPLADHALVRATLAAIKPKAVLLDVQDNHGGINPNLFVEWWTDRPYTDTETRVVLDPTLLEDEAGEAHISSINGPVRAWYGAELAKKAPGQRFSSPRPFMCRPGTCSWDNRYVPKHRVTSAPVALILGPDCASSCDALAWHFDQHDIGPVVGRPAMAGFTTHRARFDVVLRPGDAPLGTIDYAISYDTAPGDDRSIEGSQVHIDAPVPRTFANHRRYDAVLVERAIDALARWKAP